MLNGVRFVAVRDVASIAHSVSRKMRHVAVIAHSVGRKMRRLRLSSATMSHVTNDIWSAEIAFSKIEKENDAHKNKNVA